MNSLNNCISLNIIIIGDNHGNVTHCVYEDLDEYVTIDGLKDSNGNAIVFESREAHNLSAWIEKHKLNNRMFNMTRSYDAMLSLPCNSLNGVTGVYNY